MKNIILKNRYTLLVTVLTVYIVVLVIEGFITGRQAQVLDFENPFFDLNIKDLEGLRERRAWPGYFTQRPSIPNQGPPKDQHKIVDSNYGFP